MKSILQANVLLPARGATLSVTRWLPLSKVSPMGARDGSHSRGARHFPDIIEYIHFTPGPGSSFSAPIQPMTPQRPHNRFQVATFWTFASFIALAPLPFGLVHTLSQAIFSFALFALIAWYSLARLPRGPVVPIGALAPEATGLFLLLFWIVFHLLPWAPRAWNHPLWIETGTGLGMVISGGAYLAPGSAMDSLFRLLTYVGVFWLALQWGRDRRYAKRLLAVVAVSGTLYALYGLIDIFTGSGQVLWVEKRQGQGVLSSTLINRNSYATLAGLGLLSAVGLYLAVLAKAMDVRRTGRDRIVNLLQQALGKGAPLLTCILVLLAALFLTKSRAGISSSLLALAFLVMFFGLHGKSRSLTTRIAALALPMALLASFILSGDGWRMRLAATDMQGEQRLRAYEQTWRAIEAAPWHGHGPGSFSQVFPMFADAGSFNFDKAHNDWLETVFDVGLPAAILWFALLGGLGLRCLVGVFRRRRDRTYPAVGCSACLLVGIHSLADFSLQIPAVTITFTLLLGVGVGQSWNSPPSPTRLPGMTATGGTSPDIFESAMDIPFTPDRGVKV